MYKRRCEEIGGREAKRQGVKRRGEGEERQRGNEGRRGGSLDFAKTWSGGKEKGEELHSA